MLVLGRQEQQAFLIKQQGKEDIRVVVNSIERNGRRYVAKVGIDAPKDAIIVREEIDGKPYYVIEQDGEIIKQGYIKTDKDYPTETEGVTIYKSKEEFLSAR